MFVIFCKSLDVCPSASPVFSVAEKHGFVPGWISLGRGQFGEYTPFGTDRFYLHIVCIWFGLFLCFVRIDIRCQGLLTTSMSTAFLLFNFHNFRIHVDETAPYYNLFEHFHMSMYCLLSLCLSPHLSMVHSIIPTAFLGSCAIFGSLSLAALYAERRSMLFLGGMPAAISLLTNREHGIRFSVCSY